jgi:hypothetical protein
VANIYQDFNDQAVSVNGQLDQNGDTIVRNTELAWTLSCSLLASRIYRLAAYKTGNFQGGTAPKLQALQKLPAPGMVRFPFTDYFDSIEGRCW